MKKFFSPQNNNLADAAKMIAAFRMLSRLRGHAQMPGWHPRKRQQQNTKHRTKWGSVATDQQSTCRGIMRGGIDLTYDGERPGVDGFGSYHLSRSIFICSISACFLVAFSSLLVQMYDPPLASSPLSLPHADFARGARKLVNRLSARPVRLYS